MDGLDETFPQTNSYVIPRLEALVRVLAGSLPPVFADKTTSLLIQTWAAPFSGSELVSEGLPYAVLGGAGDDFGALRFVLTRKPRAAAPPGARSAPVSPSAVLEERLGRAVLDLSRVEAECLSLSDDVSLCGGCAVLLVPLSLPPEGPESQDAGHGLRHGLPHQLSSSAYLDPATFGKAYALPPHPSLVKLELPGSHLHSLGPSHASALSMQSDALCMADPHAASPPPAAYGAGLASPPPLEGGEGFGAAAVHNSALSPPVFTGSSHPYSDSSHHPPSLSPTSAGEAACPAGASENTQTSPLSAARYAPPAFASASQPFAPASQPFAAASQPFAASPHHFFGPASPSAPPPPPCAVLELVVGAPLTPAHVALLLASLAECCLASGLGCPDAEHMTLLKPCPPGLPPLRPPLQRLHRSSEAGMLRDAASASQTSLLEALPADAAALLSLCPPGGGPSLGASFASAGNGGGMQRPGEGEPCASRAGDSLSTGPYGAAAGAPPLANPFPPSQPPPPGHAPESDGEADTDARACKLRLSDLRAQFGCGVKEAAQNLGVCVTTLKRSCRRHGITRWPRRQLVKLQRALLEVGSVGAGIEEEEDDDDAGGGAEPKPAGVRDKAPAGRRARGSARSADPSALRGAAGARSGSAQSTVGPSAHVLVSLAARLANQGAGPGASHASSGSAQTSAGASSLASGAARGRGARSATRRGAPGGGGASEDPAAGPAGCLSSAPPYFSSCEALDAQGKGLLDPGALAGLAPWATGAAGGELGSSFMQTAPDDQGGGGSLTPMAGEGSQAALDLRHAPLPADTDASSPRNAHAGPAPGQALCTPPRASRLSFLSLGLQSPGDLDAFGEGAALLGAETGMDLDADMWAAAAAALGITPPRHGQGVVGGRGLVGGQAAGQGAGLRGGPAPLPLSAWVLGNGASSSILLAQAGDAGGSPALLRQARRGRAEGMAGAGEGASEAGDLAHAGAGMQPMLLQNQLGPEHGGLVLLPSPATLGTGEAGHWARSACSEQFV